MIVATVRALGTILYWFGVNVTAVVESYRN